MSDEDRVGKADNKATEGQITMSTVVPMISYEDGPRALAWLAAAFGFIERARMLDENGRLTHGEMETDGGGVIMLATPSVDYECPKRHRAHCERARAWNGVPWVIDGVLVYVDSIDEHFARASATGATLLSGIEEGFPGRRYRVEDLEGHRWMFLQRQRSQPDAQPKRG